MTEETKPKLVVPKSWRDQTSEKSGELLGIVGAKPETQREQVLREVLENYPKRAIPRAALRGVSQS
jgi:hypothetical protein